MCTGPTHSLSRVERWRSSLVSVVTMTLGTCFLLESRCSPDARFPAPAGYAIVTRRSTCARRKPRSITQAWRALTRIAHVAGESCSRANIAHAG